MTENIRNFPKFLYINCGIELLNRPNDILSNTTYTIKYLFLIQACTLGSSVIHVSYFKYNYK